MAVTCRESDGVVTDKTSPSRFYHTITQCDKSRIVTVKQKSYNHLSRTQAMESHLFTTQCPFLRPPSRHMAPCFCNVSNSRSIVLALTDFFSDIFSDISLAEKAGFPFISSIIAHCLSVSSLLFSFPTSLPTFVISEGTFSVSSSFSLPIFFKYASSSMNASCILIVARKY